MADDGRLCVNVSVHHRTADARMTVVNDEREKMWLAALRCESQA